MHQSRNLIIGPPPYLQTFSYPRRGRKCFLVVPRAAAEHWSNSPPFLEGPSGLWGSGADFQTAGDRFRQFRLDGHLDRKSTRLNSSHEWISYAVFCLKKKKKKRR